MWPWPRKWTHTFTVPSDLPTYTFEHVDAEGSIRRWSGMKAEALDIAFAVRPLRWYEYAMPWRWRRSVRTILDCNLIFSRDPRS